MLRIEGLTKNFGGLCVLKNVTFSVPKSAIYGVIGPNGSGKTTLFNCISGTYHINGGKILFFDEEIQNTPSYKISHRGIGRTYQNVRPFANLSVYDNIRVGQIFSERSTRAEEKEKIEEIIEFVGLKDKEQIIAGGLPLAVRKRLEIGRALAGKPELLLLDEVAAGLNLTESQEIVELVQKINKMGVTVLMVEHVMPIIMTVCSKIIVLAEGNKIAEGDPYTISTDIRVIESYLGAEAMKEVKMESKIHFHS